MVKAEMESVKRGRSRIGVDGLRGEGGGGGGGGEVKEGRRASRVFLLFETGRARDRTLFCL